MTPEEMATLLNTYGTPDNGSIKVRRNPIRKRRYNVIVRTKDNEVVETYEMVTLKVAREIRNEAHDEDMFADIIEDWTIDYNDREINPKPMISTLVDIPAKNRAPQPVFTEPKAKIRHDRDMLRAQDNLSRSIKNKKFEYHMFRAINKSLGIDIQDTQAKIAEFLKNAIDNGTPLNEFKIIYCGIAESWGKEIVER